MKTSIEMSEMVARSIEFAASQNDVTVEVYLQNIITEHASTIDYKEVIPALEVPREPVINPILQVSEVVSLVTESEYYTNSDFLLENDDDESATFKYKPEAKSFFDEHFSKYGFPKYRGNVLYKEMTNELVGLLAYCLGDDLCEKAYDSGIIPSVNDKRVYKENINSVDRTKLTMTKLMELKVEFPSEGIIGLTFLLKMHFDQIATDLIMEQRKAKLKLDIKRRYSREAKIAKLGMIA